MTITKVTSSAAEIERLQPGIAQLFEECFGRALDVALWRWLYLENPSVSSVVVVVIDKDRIVGHYGVIGLPLRNRAGDTRLSGLSVTSMVAKDYRAHGLFASMGEVAYAECAQLGIRLVVGFPNKLAIPGRRKKLHWTIQLPDYVATLDRAMLVDALNIEAQLNDGNFQIDLSDSAYRRWRLAKPGTTYIDCGNLIYKKFEENIDLVYWENHDSLEDMTTFESANVILRSDNNKYRDFSTFDYQFGGREFFGVFNPDFFHRQMLMSDVF